MNCFARFFLNSNQTFNEFVQSCTKLYLGELPKLYSLNWFPVATATEFPEIQWQIKNIYTVKKQ